MCLHKWLWILKKICTKELTDRWRWLSWKQYCLDDSFRCAANSSKPVENVRFRVTAFRAGNVKRSSFYHGFAARVLAAPSFQYLCGYTRSVWVTVKKTMGVKKKNESRTKRASYEHVKFFIMIKQFVLNNEFFINDRWF